MTLLELSGLRAGYGGSVVLDGVDLTVGEGEVVALLGINGAGKSTTMRVITGLLARGGGRVVFGGVDIPTFPPIREWLRAYACHPKAG